MKTIRTTVALLVVAGALPAVQAQSIPSVEACIRYAEADAAYEAAVHPVDAAYDAAFEAALQQAKAAYVAAYEAALQQAKAAYVAAYEAAMQPAEAAFEAVKQPAQQALETAYFASYDLDGGPRSDVQDVMVKLREHHRQRCRELHGL